MPKMKTKSSAKNAFYVFVPVAPSSAVKPSNVTS